MLGVDDPKFLAPEARAHRGAGVEFYVRLGADADLERIYADHEAAGAVIAPLASAPWGERTFHAHLAGYRFLIARARSDADSSLRP